MSKPLLHLVCDNDLMTSLQHPDRQRSGSVQGHDWLLGVHF